MQSVELKRTPLHSLQQAQGARFVAFAGWEMAVSFAGVVAEHQAVRQRVGLFDVSHMGEILVEGPEALQALQHIVTNDVTKLGDGRAQYNLMCTETGGIVDDLIVYREGPERYFLCVNASRRLDDFMHLRQHSARFRCRIVDVSDAYAQMALQGPQANTVLAAVTAYPVHNLKPFSWVDIEVAGQTPVRVARTGYTGEPGFELYCAPSAAPALWQALCAAGLPYDLAVCGLGARDTLRLEMKYPLYGNDIDLDHNPLEAGLAWVVKLGKGPFVGSEALLAVQKQGCKRLWVGFKMRERGIPRQGYAIVVDGVEVGLVTSGTHSPTLGEPIGCGYVTSSHAKPDTPISIVIRNRPVAAVVTATPFLKRGPS